MQLKENERGIYLFFPTGPEHLEQTTKKMVQMASTLAIYATWDLYKVVWPAHMKLQEQLRAAQTNQNPEETING